MPIKGQQIFVYVQTKIKTEDKVECPDEEMASLQNNNNHRSIHGIDAQLVPLW